MTNTNVRSKVSRGSLEREDLLQAKAERVEMTLNTDSSIASGLLIQRLTELYENPIEATVRETISNALDAIMESHSGDCPEIRITSPSSLNPVLTVRDNGVGMSYEDLKNVYSKYGASTKMNNMDQIGAYGLGAKAPLAYGTEFTVTSVKNGERTTIIVAREELTNYIKIVGTEKTDAPSGATVSVPVNNNDVSEFISYIDLYETNPIDKDNVKVFIDDEEVVESNYIEITDELTIFEGAEGPIKGRLWIKNSVDLITSILTGCSKDSAISMLNYLIGGWAYRNPSKRNSWSNEKGFMIELKSGVVSFNSSRDAILNNERYEKLEELVLKYLQSEKFLDDLISSINNIEIERFKAIVMKLLRNNQNSIEIKNGKINVRPSSFGRSYSLIAKSYSLSDLIHSSGYTIDSMFDDVPKSKKNTVAIYEKLEGYKKTTDNYILDSSELKDDVDFIQYKYTNISDMLGRMNKIFNGEKKSHSLESVLLNLMLRQYGKNDELYVTFITDLDPENEEKTFNKVRSGRKTIVKYRNNGNIGKYESHLIYTEHSKSDIEKMMKKLDAKGLDYKVFSAAEMDEKITEYRKLNRTESSKKTVDRLNVNVYKLVTEPDVKLDRIESSEIDEEFDTGKRNVIIVSRDGYVRSNKLKMIQSWYSNTKNIDTDEFQLFVTSGQHRKYELEILKDLGELYEDPDSQPAGHSIQYKELVGNNVAGMHLMSKNDEKSEIKAFIRILSMFGMRRPSTVIELMIEEYDHSLEVAKAANFEMEDLNKDLLNELSTVGKQAFGDSYRSYDWILDSSTERELLSLLTKEKQSLLEALSPIAGGSYNGRKYRITEDNTFVSVGNTSFRPRVDEIENLYALENPDIHDKLIKKQTEAYLEFMNEIFKTLSEIKFD